MNTKAISLTLISLLAGAASSTPALAADRDNDNYRHERQQPNSVNSKLHQFLKTPQRAERQAPQRAERQAPQRAERQSPQRVERENRRDHRPVAEQRRDHERFGKAVPEHRRHIETRRSFHIERPRYLSKPRYYRYRHVPRSRYYLGIHIYRPHGYLYPGFGFYYNDHDAFRWLAFTVLTLAIIDQLNEHQQRMHEQALIRATSAEVGDTLYWTDGDATGSVTVLYIGTDDRGREYREFRQTVSAHGRTETSYGSAYLKSNGIWEVSRTD